MPTSAQLTVTRQNMNDGLYEALFVSELQQSDNPTTNMVAKAISRTMQRLGTDGSAHQMAQEFGDHPDAASEWMRWVRQLAVRAALTDGLPAMTLRRDGWRHERHVCRYEPAVRTAYRVDRGGELCLCGHCISQPWTALSAQGWTIWPADLPALAPQAA